MLFILLAVAAIAGAAVAAYLALQTAARRENEARADRAAHVQREFERVQQRVLEGQRLSEEAHERALEAAQRERSLRIAEMQTRVRSQPAADSTTVDEPARLEGESAQPLEAVPSSSFSEIDPIAAEPVTIDTPSSPDVQPPDETFSPGGGDFGGGGASGSW